MSADGRYWLHYEPQPYVDPTPMDVDASSLAQWGGEMVIVGEYERLWIAAKGVLPMEMVASLRADQVLESVDGGPWRDVRA